MHRIAYLSLMCFLCLGLIFTNSIVAADKRPCADDVAKFCKDVKPGKGAIADCLKQHESELSDACKNKISNKAEKGEKAKEFIQGCNEDVSKFCKDVKPGHGAIVRCLKSHETELSSQCSEKMKSSKAK